MRRECFEQPRLRTLLPRGVQGNASCCDKIIKIWHVSKDKKNNKIVAQCSKRYIYIYIYISACHTCQHCHCHSNIAENNEYYNWFTESLRSCVWYGATLSANLNFLSHAV